MAPAPPPNGRGEINPSALMFANGTGALQPPPLAACGRGSLGGGKDAAREVLLKFQKRDFTL